MRSSLKADIYRGEIPEPTEKLEISLDIYLLRELGFKPDKIKGLFSNCIKYNYTDGFNEDIESENE